MMTLRSCLLALWLCLFSPWLWAQTAVPTLSAPVMDTAQMMTPQARAELNQHLLAYAGENGSQIVVLTVEAIAPETTFDYVTRVMDAWKLGRAGVDDGVLLLLVKNERKTHLAVGRGLEGAIPDAYAKRILDEVLRPHLKQGRTDEGIHAAVTQIEKLIAGEALPPPAKEKKNMGDVFLFFIVAAFFVGHIIADVFHKTVGAVSGGAIVFISGVLLGWSWQFPLLLGVGLAVVISRNMAYVSSSGGGGGGGGRSSGGGSGGGWSSGGGSSGGYSGGGGSFGGGGASGGW